MIRHVFVYGTLRPGDVRWHHLAPFVVDDGMPDSVPGQLFDTGLDYPAALFGPNGTVIGHTCALLDVVEGEYSRVTVRTGLGIDAWAYTSGPGLTLTHIPSGDWFLHRPPRP